MYNINFEIIIIFLLAFLNILSALLSILSPNPIISLLFLILMFSNVFFFFILMGLEFLSFLVLLIYVGAISILFIFVLMILDIKVLVIKKYFYKNIFFYFIFILFVINLFFNFINIKVKDLFYINLNNNTNYDWINTFYDLSDIQSVGIVIFNNYIIHFFIITFILFIVLIGSIAIAKNKNISKINLKNSKSLSNFDLLLNYDYKKFNLNNK